MACNPQPPNGLNPALVGTLWADISCCYAAFMAGNCSTCSSCCNPNQYAQFVGLYSRCLDRPRLETVGRNETMCPKTIAAPKLAITTKNSNYSGMSRAMKYSKLIQTTPGTYTFANKKTPVSQNLANGSAQQTVAVINQTRYVVNPNQVNSGTRLTTLGANRKYSRTNFSYRAPQYASIGDNVQRRLTPFLNPTCSTSVCNQPWSQTNPNNAKNTFSTMLNTSRQQIPMWQSR